MNLWSVIHLKVAHQVYGSLKYKNRVTMLCLHMKCEPLVIPCNIAFESLAVMVIYPSHACKSRHALFVISHKDHIMIWLRFIDQLPVYEPFHRILRQPSLFRKIFCYPQIVRHRRRKKKRLLLFSLLIYKRVFLMY